SIVVLAFLIAHYSAATHTLPLHDALPISLLASSNSSRSSRPPPRTVTNETGSDDKSNLEIIGGRVCSGNASPIACTCCWTSRSADRKSTRLNSSHVKISYAVF